MYKIPPLKKNEGHRAQEWGDLGDPLWKGRLRIIERSSGVAIQFEDATTGEYSRAHKLTVVDGVGDVVGLGRRTYAACAFLAMVSVLADVSM